VTAQAKYTLRRAWWRKFHPLVRAGWYVATTGSNRPASQTVLGFAIIAVGVALRQTQKTRTTLIYTDTVLPGEVTRIRVYRGTSAPSEVTVRT
jgi:hypothetical protein